MQSRIPPAPNATAWHAVALRPGIAEIRTAADEVIAIVVNLPEPTQALPIARIMAASEELRERLGDLLVDIALLTDGEPSHAEIMATVSLSVLRANALLVRLSEATP